MNIDFIKEEIKSKEAVLIYFSGQDCGVCEVLKPKIKELFSVKFPKVMQYNIDAADYPDIAASFSVFSVPTCLVFLDGKESVRKSRNISLGQFEQEFTRPYSLFFG